MRREQEKTNEWKVCSIEEVCLRVTSGGTPSRSNPAFYDNGTIDWIKTGELKDWFVNEIAEKITEEAVRSSSAKVFPANTVLMAMYGDGRTIGSVGILRHPAATNQACCAMIVDANKCLPKFLLYSLIYYRKNLVSLALGGSQRNLNGKTIRNFKIGIPSVEIQSRITIILSAYDDLIENNTQRIQILEEMARRIYEEWFVQFRFPGYEHVRMVESELGLIPSDWNVKALSEVAAINKQSIKRGQEPDEILYIDIASVSTGKIDIAQAIPFSDAPGRARRIVRHGDIIWSNVRPNRKSYALVTNPPQNMIVSTGFTVISASSVPYSFLYLALTTEDFASYLTNRAKGAAYPAVGSEDFANARITIPNAKLLALFDEVAEPMQLEKNLLLRKNDILRNTRDLLLPKVISGEIDVSTFPEPVSD